MRKIFVSICILLLLGQFINAQESLPSSTAKYKHQINTSIFSNDYMQLSQLLTTDNNWFINQESDYKYYQLLSKIYNSTTDKEQLIFTFLEEYPNAFNRERLNLWLGLLSMDNKNYSKAIYYFERVDKTGLNKDDVSCLDVAHALALSQKYYNKISDTTSKESNLINSLLNNAIRINGRYSEKALYYIAIIKWLEDDKQVAYNILKDTNWTKSIENNAKYLVAVMMFDVASKQKALNNAINYLSQNNKRENKKELLRSIGITYYSIKDYPNAIKYLSEVYSAEEYNTDYIALYSYSSSLYNQGNYNNAAEVLKRLVARMGTNRKLTNIEAKCQLLLANTYVKLDKPTEAIAVYSTLLSGVDIQKGNDIAERAMYNSILLQSKLGTSSFGQSVNLSLDFLNTFTDSSKRNDISSLLSKVFIDSKDYKNSLESIKKIKNADKEILKAKQYILVRLATSIVNKEEYSEKERYLLDAIKLSNISPYYKDALIEMASLELEKGKYDNAEGYANKVISINRSMEYQQGMAYYIKAYALFNQKRYTEAYKVFNLFINNSDANDSYIEDSYIRMGDCMYQNQTNLDKAAELYIKADNVREIGSDKALMRLVNIYAIQGKFDAEIVVINQILARTKDKSIEPHLLYSKGRAIVLSRKSSDKAISVFDSLIEKYPNTQYARLSMLDIAMIYYNDNDKLKAIESYKKLINNYPNSSEATQALADLRSVYLQDDRLNEYIAYTKSLGENFRLNENDEVKLLFIQAENLYRKNSDKAISSLEDYVAAYPNSIYINKAKSYLADLYYSKGELDKAMVLYQDIANSNIEEDLKIQAIERLAEMNYAQTNYTDAAKEYTKLYNSNNISSNDKAKIIIPLVKSLYLGKEYHKLDSLTDKIDISYLSKEQQDEIILLKAKNLIALSQKTKALDVFKKIDKNIDTPVGAESYVIQSQLTFELGNSKKAKTDILSFIKQSTTEQYWLARAFILLSDIYHKEGDIYTARQYLESLKGNYTNTDDEIHNMIESRLNKLQSTK